RDTAQMHPLVSLALDRFVPQSVRLSLVRSWSSGLAMFPKGGDQIWGSGANGAADDLYQEEHGHSIGGVLTLHDRQGNVSKVLDADGALELLASVSSPAFANIIYNLHSWGVDPEAAQHPERWKNQPRKWTNVLETPLPNAPDFEIYCLYGVGKSTERGFHYTDDFVPPAPLPSGKLGPSIPFRLHSSINKPEVELTAGVQQGDGDGTVPLLSMGYMCLDGWANYPGLNPARSRTIVREYVHTPSSPMISPRGIPTTADHVDIMGNHDLITDVLKIASGERLNNDIVSKIKDFSAKIKLRSTQ
ncbi:MAG: hypothetical protein K2Z81_07710, partial [Cyanobacteria bacterium]|nr:hypothetical protein [Cyanobacteriota bacterium]